MKDVVAAPEELNYWIKRMDDYHSGHKQEVCNEIFGLLEKYIHSVAHSFKGLEHDDLFAIGSLALVEQLEKYNPREQKVVPMTYMKRHLYGAMYSAVAEELGLSKNDASIGKQINKAVAELEERDIEPTVSNIVRWINRPRITEEVVYNNLKVTRRASNILHLDTEIDEKQHTVADTLAALQSNPEEIFLEKEKIDLVRDAINSLTELESKVISLCELQECSLAKTAELLGVSPTEVKKARTSAIIRLHNNSNLNFYVKRAAGGEYFDYCDCNINISFRDTNSDEEETFLFL